MFLRGSWPEVWWESQKIIIPSIHSQMTISISSQQWAPLPIPVLTVLWTCAGELPRVCEGLRYLSSWGFTISKNQTCNARQYAGGLNCCHQRIMLDADQEIQHELLRYHEISVLASRTPRPKRWSQGLWQGISCKFILHLLSEKLMLENMTFRLLSRCWRQRHDCHEWQWWSCFVSDIQQWWSCFVSDTQQWWSCFVTNIFVDAVAALWNVYEKTLQMVMVVSKKWCTCRSVQLWLHYTK